MSRRQGIRKIEVVGGNLKESFEQAALHVMLCPMTRPVHDDHDAAKGLHVLINIQFPKIASQYDQETRAVKHWMRVNCLEQTLLVQG
ncbi:MAG: hypothetical protein IPK17_14880 [Chloroflexi bacterium]|uniref:hypothetical protein n=1 Tax=Candidatus Flexifilum breve TaxID=3140694 RepID=UPI00313689E8|nr:hypothetical protein [Chloroflexota bacterium]